MNQAGKVRGYQGGYLIGFIIIAAVALRTILYYRDRASLDLVIGFLVLYSLLYILEPWLSTRIRWTKALYFPLQTVCVIAFTNLRPFTDVSSLLYVPLCLQVMRLFSGRAALIGLGGYFALLTVQMMLGLGWLAGLALALIFLAVCAFLISYDHLYLRTQADQADSLRLLGELQVAHQQLQEHAARAEELAAARERNRLAHELHDSVGQTIFGITFISQSARLLLDKEPSRVEEQMDRLEKMTQGALFQLRSMIAELHPQ